MSGTGLIEQGPVDPRLAAAWLSWHDAMGVDVAFGDAPLPSAGCNARFAGAKPQSNRLSQGTAARPPVRVMGSRGTSRECAAACQSLTELETALANFEGCALRKTAHSTCFGDGNPASKIVLIGEAPGAEEDRRGKPFVGASGRLLDTMLGSIGLDRTNVWITNLIFWRPPGNRTPTNDEIAICLPFVHRQLELIRPRIIVFVGGTAAKAMLGTKEGVMRMRGRRDRIALTDDLSAESLVTFHPAFLLRQPLQKKQAWADLRTLAGMIDEVGLA